MRSMCWYPFSFFRRCYMRSAWHFMPPGELFTTEMNLVPRQPTWDYPQGRPLVKIPLVRFVCNSFITAGLITNRDRLFPVLGCIFLLLPGV